MKWNWCGRRTTLPFCVEMFPCCCEDPLALVFTPASQQAHLMGVRATSQQRRALVAVGGTSEFSSRFCCTSFCFHRDNSRAGLPYSCGWISPLARSLMPAGGRGAAVNAVLWLFLFVCFFYYSRYAGRVNESLPCIYLISQQSRDTVVTSVAGMLLYVSWQLKKKNCACDINVRLLLL